LHQKLIVSAAVRKICNLFLKVKLVSSKESFTQTHYTFFNLKTQFFQAKETSLKPVKLKVLFSHLQELGNIIYNADKFHHCKPHLNCQCYIKEVQLHLPEFNFP